MTEKYYMKVLEALGEKISDQDQTIYFQKHQIERLEAQLAEAERIAKEREEKIDDLEKQLYAVGKCEAKTGGIYIEPLK